MVFLPLSHEYIMSAHVGDLFNYVSNNELTIVIANKTFKMNSVAKMMRKSEIQEYLMNTPHVRDYMNPTNFDSFCITQETSGPINTNVSKSELGKHVNGFKNINDYTLHEIYNVPFKTFNLRTLLAVQGYVKISSRFLPVQQYCDMLGLTAPLWGYQEDIKLWAKYQGFAASEKHKADASYEYLGIQNYPDTIMEWLLMNPERYNRDVQQVRSDLKLVIRDMRPRTYLVKKRIISLFKDEYNITEIIGISPSVAKLDSIIARYNL